MTPKMLGMGQICNLKCEKNLIPEFPDLLFGEHEDGGNYFDATIYLPKSPDKTKSIEDFFQKFDFQIQALAEYFNIPLNRLVIINQAGHQLIAGCFCFLFLSYIDPALNGYFFERLDEMFSEGWTASDSCLVEAMQRRFTPEMIQQILHGGKETT